VSRTLNSQRLRFRRIASDLLKTVHHTSVETITGGGESEDGDDQVEFEEISPVPSSVSSTEDDLKVIVVDTTRVCGSRDTHVDVSF
jgi:hypothetical protein